jgi:hypothetical protein
MILRGVMGNINVKEAIVKKKSTLSLLLLLSLLLSLL